MPDFPLRQWKEDVLETAADRFERRLSEELGVFRVEVVRELASMRVENAKLHTSLVRWMFFFWIGQFAITLTVFGLLFRN